VLIRRLDPARFPEAVALCLTADPRRRDVSTAWQDGPAMRRYGAFDARDQLAAYAAVTPERAAAPDGRFRAEVIADDGSLREALWRTIEADLIELGAASAQARVDALDELGRTFWTQRGFEETQRMHRLELVLAERPPAEVDSAWPMTTLDTARREPGFLARWTEMELAVRETWPEPNPLPGQVPSLLPEEIARRLANPHILADGFFIASDADRYVGYSGLTSIDNDPSTLETFGTGVHPAYRGGGIATTLKLHALEYAQRYGYQRVLTATANPTMLAINERLGFRRASTQIRLVRRFD
jgi:RimJ/RimL family protein N-acetyltransferase